MAPRRTSREDDMLARMWVGGISTAEIAEKLGMPISVVRSRAKDLKARRPDDYLTKIRREAGSRPRRTSVWTEVNISRLRELYSDDGISREEIASRLGVTLPAVNSALVRFNFYRSGRARKRAA